MLSDQSLHIGGEERPLDRAIKVVKHEGNEPLHEGRGHRLTSVAGSGLDLGSVGDRHIGLLFLLSVDGRTWKKEGERMYH